MSGVPFDQAVEVLRGVAPLHGARYKNLGRAESKKAWSAPVNDSLHTGV